MSFFVRVIPEELYQEFVALGHINNEENSERAEKISQLCKHKSDQCVFIKKVLTSLPEKINWTQEGRVIYNGEIIPNSDICDLILSLRTCPERPVVWLNQFWKLLKFEGLLSENIDLTKLKPLWQSPIINIENGKENN